MIAISVPSLGLYFSQNIPPLNLITGIYEYKVIAYNVELF